ncbi:MAG: CapA family protein [Gammaproteobacteria bacterium]|nr:CapA family protein [Gammaproteobacteria bacterium]
MSLIRHAGGRCLLVAALVILSVSCATPRPSPPVLPEPEPDVSGKASGPTVLPGAPVHPAMFECRLAAVGDIMLGGTAAPEMRKYGYDYPFEKTQAILQQAQIVFGNLEGPLTESGAPATGKQYVFRSPPDKVAPALARAGFNIMSLANNHTLDYGSEGLEDTRRALEQAGIGYVGAGQNDSAARAAAYLACPPPRGSALSGVNFAPLVPKVAFLAYSLTFPEEFWAGPDKPGTAFGHERHVRTDVAAARERADIVVVSFHWGQEGKTELRDYQVQLAHAAIDAGAAAVLGHHPHILQGVERYKSGVILYSLGNFAFGSFSNTATRSVIALLTFHHGQWRELRLLPINVKNAEVVFQPRPLAGPEASQVVEHLQEMSIHRGTVLENHDGSAILVNDDG